MDEGTWDNLKSACSNGSPAGDNCEYEPAFLALMSLADPRPEVQMGATVVAARLPDWPAILQQSSLLSERTRDLRIGVLLAESLGQLHDWSGLAHGFEILWCWTTQLWEHVFPELDHEEHNDPTARLSALAHLLSDQFNQRTLYQLPLAEHAVLGVLRLRDTISIVRGKKEVARELTASEMEAFFTETEVLPLAMRLHDIDRCCAAVEALDEFLNAQPGTAGWSATRLLEHLRRSRDLLSKHLVNHQLQGNLLPAADATDSSVATVVASTASEAAVATISMHNSASLVLDDALQSARAQDDAHKEQVVADNASTAISDAALAGPRRIRSRQDATAAIDAVSEYFQIHEPASPVPLLLQRAKRLISMNFIELMHELAPNEAIQLLRQLHVVDKAG